MRVLTSSVLGVLGSAILAGCSTGDDSRVASASAASDADADVLASMLAGNSATSGAELKAAIEAASAFPLGSAENPVRAHMPPGQRAYLSRLHCQDLSRPKFYRVGSMGMSPYGNIVDGYAVTCEGSEPAETLVHIDMYHRGHVEDRAIEGFGITGRRSDSSE